MYSGINGVECEVKGERKKGGRELRCNNAKNVILTQYTMFGPLVSFIGGRRALFPLERRTPVLFGLAGEERSSPVSRLPRAVTPFTRGGEGGEILGVFFHFSAIYTSRTNTNIGRRMSSCSAHLSLSLPPSFVAFSMLRRTSPLLPPPSLSPHGTT